jgi:hypothetical protein
MREEPNDKQTQDLQELIRQNQERLSRNRKTLKEIERRTQSSQPAKPQKSSQ